jgi:Flp pilus assembly pilin Flp
LPREENVKRQLGDLLTDDRGDDLIEYALLCGLIGAIGVVAFPDIADKMSAAYSEWVSSAKDAWEPCPPAPASCP